MQTWHWKITTYYPFEEKGKEEKMNIYVIRCNDSIRYVFMGSYEDALTKKEELRQAYYEQNKWNFLNMEQYKQTCIWLISTVPNNIPS